jgi:hypothetical protein
MYWGTIPKWEYSTAITASLICRRHISGILRGVVGFQSGNGISCQMTTLKPPQVQQQAIQARLNYFLGADEYDRLFVGLEILHIKNKVLTLSVRPACTNEVRDKYSWHVAIVAESLLRQAIRKVNVIPFDI